MNKPGFNIFIIFFIVIIASGGTLWSSPNSPALVMIQNAEPHLIEHLEIPVYTRLGPNLIAGVHPVQFEILSERGVAIHLLDGSIFGREYYIIYDHSEQDCLQLFPAEKILYLEGATYIVHATAAEAAYLGQQGAEIRKITFDPKPIRSSPRAIPRIIDFDPVIAAIIDQVNQETVYQYCSDLSGENVVEIGGEPYTIKTRNSDQTAAIHNATQYGYEFFHKLGYTVEYHYFSGPGIRNVIATKISPVNPDQYVVICAHLDDMPDGELAPGADDNASGCVAVMLAAELLVPYDFNTSIIFALWTGEEQGLYGSYNYAREAYQAGMDIQAVLNLDMIAWDELQGPIINIHADEYYLPESVDLAHLMSDIIDVYELNLSARILTYGFSYSDHASFWDYGYVAVLGIEDGNDFNDYYHTINDRVQYLNMPYFTEFMKASLATIITVADYIVPELLGDIDSSGRVDGLDLLILSLAFGASEGDDNFNPEADLDYSGAIDGDDLAILKANFGVVASA
ncbi:M28 family peptidase [candidate division CSSED10-310 bacterium]|uniref:M28 family peptidase n=1 Tax=candidate division CSSED10-310 bacterium TaxID=2855610 RepID=A0ABV6YV85_UNCC1